MHELVWLIPVLPLLGALLNGVVLKGRLGKNAVAWVACGLVGLAALLALLVIGGYLGSPEHAAHQPFERDYYTWMPAGAITTPDGVKDLTVSVGFLVDPLSCVMLFVVTFVGFLIHLYSVGYMAHEDGFQRYFTYLNLFMGAMLLLVLGNNYAVLFVGWEGVGLCSYLLIGFYFKQDFPPYAGRKAFLVNRIGDFAFVVGLFALVSSFGTLKFTELFPRIAANPALVQGSYVLGLSLASFVTLCLFIGATGKSAQIPLFVWLPDAMAGPTPVSALIHAATMVTAGVYMVARSNVLYQLAPEISQLVAVIGAATALFAATIGLAQTDIKKVLAYSTVSQLGYMFLAAGLAAYSAAVFHLMTHAFFKALLFLGAGSVIHALHHEQDIWKMGGLLKKMPVTGISADDVSAYAAWLAGVRGLSATDLGRPCGPAEGRAHGMAHVPEDRLRLLEARDVRVKLLEQGLLAVLYLVLRLPGPERVAEVVHRLAHDEQGEGRVEPARKEDNGGGTRVGHGGAHLGARWAKGKKKGRPEGRPRLGLLRSPQGGKRADPRAGT